MTLTRRTVTALTLAGIATASIATLALSGPSAIIFLKSYPPPSQAGL